MYIGKYNMSMIDFSSPYTEILGELLDEIVAVLCLVFFLCFHDLQHRVFLNILGKFVVPGRISSDQSNLTVMMLMCENSIGYVYETVLSLSPSAGIYLL